LLIILLAIYQAITIPLELTFAFDFFNHYSSVTANSLIDLIFVTDILINFRTSYMDPNNGEEIIDWVIIASKYISSGQFLIDVLSTVPFN